MVYLSQNNPEYLRPVLEEVAALCKWLDEQALPLWLENGFDKELGIFHERLDIKGKPLKNSSRRLFVQCRQIAVYAYATLRGRVNARKELIEIFERVRELYSIPHKKGYWCFSITDAGCPDDNRLDSYTLAFVVFALSWLYRLNPSPAYLDLADDIFLVFEGPLSAQGEGVILGLPGENEVISQNPNMHLFEACLALYEAARRPEDLRRAKRLADVFEKKIFNRKHNAVPEKHHLGWKIWEESQNWFEPGHHFEWSWLLCQLERLDESDYSEIIRKLVIPAIDMGVDENSVVIEQVGLLNNFRLNSSRNWGTCEYIKYCSSEYQQAFVNHDLEGVKKWAVRAAEALRALRRFFLSDEGLWNDRLSNDYASLTNHVPASSFYHIAFAIAEAEKVFTRVVPQKLSFAGKKRPALFLDRDGVINVDVSYAHRPEQIEFVPRIFELVQIANKNGYLVVVVTNQSGVARSYYSESDVIALHYWMSQQFFKNGAKIDVFYHCPYFPGAGSSPYNRDEHFDRKPNAGMLKRAALEWGIDLEKSFLVGDKATDCACASSVAMTSVLSTGDHQSAVDSFLEFLKS